MFRRSQRRQLRNNSALCMSDSKAICSGRKAYGSVCRVSNSDSEYTCRHLLRVFKKTVSCQVQPFPNTLPLLESHLINHFWILQRRRHDATTSTIPVITAFEPVLGFLVRHTCKQRSFVDANDVWWDGTCSNTKTVRPREIGGGMAKKMRSEDRTGEISDGKVKSTQTVKRDE